jgi:2'-5' RNA ligase
MAETAIIVPVPEAEALIGGYRREHTDEGRHGMIAHVTLLYPFTDTTKLDERRTSAAADVVAAFAAFDFSLASVGRFPANPRVLSLRPEPEAPFRELTRALVRAFPEHQPYGGKYSDPVPHSTIAIGDDALLEAIEASVMAELPIAARAAVAELVERDDAAGGWRLRRRLPLG